jgi:activator of 2-hydroxyglutaryl-CoA dehydratase
LVNTIAVKCVSGLSNAAEVLGVGMPSEVAIVGGFAENKAILKALELHGITAVVPPFAGLATQAGAAAEALRRAEIASTTSEALAMFPNKEL